ncbi:MAG: hypothetical protein JXK07_13410 [Spirochaetes bacterium]|nr:hypothetical protein [Spirochaetota bacterium]
MKNRRLDRHKRPGKMVRFPDDMRKDVESEAERLGLNTNQFIVNGMKIILEMVKNIKPAGKKHPIFGDTEF